MEANFPLDFCRQSKKSALVRLRRRARDKRDVRQAPPNLHERRFQCRTNLHCRGAAPAAYARDESTRHEAEEVISPHTFIRCNEGGQTTSQWQNLLHRNSRQPHVGQTLLVEARTRELRVDQIANRLICKHSAVEALDLLLRARAQSETRSNNIYSQLFLDIRRRRDDGICAK